jgi:hypothetical protein
MSTLTIILAIIIILLGYYVYTLVNAVPTVASKLDLSTVQLPVSPKLIKNPYSANYTIGVWVYITNYTQNIDQFITYGDNNAASKTMFSLNMDKPTPRLYCQVLTNNGLQKVYLTSETETFPIQKWVYITVSVSNFIECYLNGQFVNAVQVDPAGVKAVVAPKDPNAGATFSFSHDNLPLPIVLTGVSRWDTPLSSGDVYNNYSKGNGYEEGIFGPGYKISVNVKHGSDTYNYPVLGKT